MLLTILKGSALQQTVQRVFDDLRRAYIELQIVLDGSEPIDLTEDLKIMHIVREADFKKAVYKLQIFLTGKIYDLINKSSEIFFNLKIFESLDNIPNNNSYVTSRDLVLKTVTFPKLELGDKKPLYVGTFECLERPMFYLDDNKRTINLKDRKIIDAVMYHIHLHKSKLELKQVVINKFKNDNVYNEIQIPNLPFFKALEFMDKNYAFYSDGPAKIYYENGILYILNHLIDHNYVKNMYHRNKMHIFIRDRASAYEGYIDKSGAKIDEETIHFVGKYTYQINEDQFKLIGGEKGQLYTEKHIVDFDKSTEFAQNIHQLLTNKKLPVINNLKTKDYPHHPFTDTHLINNLRTELLKVMLEIRGTSAMNHNVNTIYHLDYQKETEAKLSGLYFCESQVLRYKMIAGGEYKPEATLILKNLQLAKEEDVTKSQETKNQELKDRESGKNITTKNPDKPGEGDNMQDWRDGSNDIDDGLIGSYDPE